MLSRYPDDVVVVGEARDRDEALAALREADSDVVLLDVRLKGDSGLDLCGDILREQPQCRVSRPRPRRPTSASCTSSTTSTIAWC